MVLGPMLATPGFACLLAFVVLMARPPHHFSGPAKGVLVAGVLMYLGSGVLAYVWMMAVAPKIYAMWLRSFDPDWGGGEEGWWGRYAMVERALGRWEHGLYEGVVACGKVVCEWWRMGFRGRRRRWQGEEGGGDVIEMAIMRER